MAASVIKCCKECRDRHENCWTGCEKYLAEKQEHQRMKKIINEDKRARQAVNSVLYRTIKKRGKMNK